MVKILNITILLVALSLSVLSQSEEDKQAVKQACLDYIESVYEVNPAKAERSVHPDLAKRGFFAERNKEGYSPTTMTFTQLLELTKTYNKEGRIPKNAVKEAIVFDVSDQTASAKITAIWGIDYIHLAKYDGKWKIINILWQSPPPKK